MVNSLGSYPGDRGFESRPRYKANAESLARAHGCISKQTFFWLRVWKIVQHPISAPPVFAERHRRLAGWFNKKSY